jgi:MATE family multidrug resistance protein
MFRLENIYYRVLITVSGFVHNTKVAVDALSIWLVTILNPQPRFLFL